jgi:AraC-like DNA-binding protein
MSENSAHPSLFRFRGSSFDDMVETLGNAFGAFSAEPVGDTRDFQWGIDVCASEHAVLLSGYHQTEFQFDIEATSHTTEYLSIVLPQNGGMGVKYGADTATAGRGKLLLYNNFEPDSVVMYGQENVIDELLLNWSVVLQAIGETFETPLKGSLNLLRELDLATPAGQTIANLTITIMSGMRDNGPLLQSPIAMTRLTEALADLIVRLVPHRLSHLLEKKPCLIAPRQVRRAMDFMQANIDRPITMTMVAEAAGVSTRALEIAFRAFKETTPAAYLQTLRLRAVRQDLLDPTNPSTVKDVCLKWGFFHFGRFSAVYRATYGEKPSETKKRVCGSV